MPICADPCQETAAPAEPRFTLRASDPLAPFLVSILSSLRYGDFEAAEAKIGRMGEVAAEHYAIEPDLDGARAALDYAMAMFRWQQQREEASK